MYLTADSGCLGLARQAIYFLEEGVQDETLVWLLPAPEPGSGAGRLCPRPHAHAAAHGDPTTHLHAIPYLHARAHGHACAAYRHAAAAYCYASAAHGHAAAAHSYASAPHASAAYSYPQTRA